MGTLDRKSCALASVAGSLCLSFLTCKRGVCPQLVEPLESYQAHSKHRRDANSYD